MPTLFAKLPETVQMFTGNGIVMSSLTAIILNLLFNGLKEEELSEKNAQLAENISLK